MGNPFEKPNQGAVLYIAGTAKSVETLSDGDTGRSMEKNREFVLVYEQEGIFDDPKAPSLSNHQNFLPQGVTTATVIPIE